MASSLRRSLIAALFVVSTSVAVAFPGAAFAVNGCRSLSGGDGSAGSPFVIATQADLVTLSSLGAACSAHSPGYHFRQTADIDLTGVAWIPIGPAGAEFNGVYDGGGHTIRGLRVDDGGFPYPWKGLFGHVEGTVRNLVIRDATIVGINTYYGFVAGEIEGDALIENVAVHDSTIISGGASEMIGGIAGAADGGTIRDAHVRGVRLTSTNLNDYVGGIVGYMTDAYPSGTPSRLVRVSAVVTIEGAGSYVGGVAGIISMKGTITDAYARGSIHGDSKVGGVLGAVYEDGGPLTRTYSTARVTADGTAGGAVGDVMDFGGTAPVPAVATFWDTESSGIATSGDAAVGKTTAQLRSLATFSAAGYGITSVWQAPIDAIAWGICPTANDGYPYLLSEYSDANAPCRTVPSAPARVTAVAGSGHIDASWEPPGSDGGTPVTSYTATAVMQPQSGRGAKSCTAQAPATSCTITGLRNGRAYRISVVAVNRTGTSVAARSEPVTPRAAMTVLSARWTGAVVESRVRVRGAGRLTQVGKPAGSLAIACRAPARRPTREGVLVLRCRLTAGARRALTTAPLRVRVVTLFAPADGSPETVTRLVRLPRSGSGESVTG